MATTNPSITTFDPDSKLWVCRNCHTALVLPKDFTSKLNRDDLSDSAQWVQLNVGGKIFSTTIDTLTKQPGSMLELMFNGQYKLTKKNGCVMIDRDGTYFNHILNWLRDGVIPLLKPRLYPSLAQEADFYNLVAMKNAIEELTLQCTADMSRKEVIDNVLAARITFKVLNLSGQDLSNLNLENAEFSYACLHGVNFKGANLRDATLNNCDAPEAYFDGADSGFGSLRNGNFTRSSFVGADLTDADFSGADLTKANLSMTIVTNTKFDNAIMKEAKLSEKLYRIALEGGATF